MGAGPALVAFGKMHVGAKNAANPQGAHHTVHLPHHSPTEVNDRVVSEMAGLTASIPSETARICSFA